MHSTLTKRAMTLAKLPTRKIGNHSVSALGYGAMVLGGAYAPKLPDEERFKVLDTLYESGYTNWDTADVYGDNEDMLGEWCAVGTCCVAEPLLTLYPSHRDGHIYRFKRTGKRDEIFLATKCGLRPEPGKVISGEPTYIHKAIEKSLERLGTDYVDLYYLHRADLNVPIELSVRAMAELVKQGKVKYLGLSEVSSETLRRAHAVHPIAALQVEYSPFCLDIEDEKIGLLKTARELGVTIVAYSPLGRGLLTGRYKSVDDFAQNDWRRSVPRYTQNFPEILKLCETLSAVGKKYDATAGQIALAWLLAQGDDIIPIPGTTKIANIRENIGALSIQLSPEDVEQVRQAAIAADAVVEGDRYPAEHMAFLFADTPPLRE
ncbi:Aldo/keto reductase [Cubamyces sp. BRFM 1775]|nr:Aldo/keto reductase [Cubamyces sp. BRFM 1775]